MENVAPPADTAIETKAPEKQRLYYFDLLRTVAIVAMVFCHVVISLGDHEEGFASHFGYFFGAVVLGEYLAVAHAFMFAMGVFICFSRKNSPGLLLLRGVIYYFLNFVLNFFRYGISTLVGAAIDGEFASGALEVFFTHDIFSFVGLALCLTGLLKLLKLKEVHIAIIGVALSLIGSFCTNLIEAPLIADFFISDFFSTTSIFSAFSLFNWYIFVALGLLFGSLLKKVENKDKLYKILFFVTLPSFALYLALTFVFGTFFLSKDHSYYGLSTGDALGLLSSDLLLLSVFYFLAKHMSEKALKPFVLLSANTTSIYVISWIIIGTLDVVLWYVLELIVPYWAIYLMGVGVLIASVFLSVLYKYVKAKVLKKKQKSVA